MNDAWTARWNERFGREEFAYGTEPNEYFKQQLDKLSPGSILLPADGEGRNGVYAARKGWSVSAFDISEEGRKKALRLASTHGVSIDYRILQLESNSYPEHHFDAVALIYAHFPASIKSSYHHILKKFIRKGGVLLFEAFSKNHLPYIEKNERVGGPRDLDMLFSVEEIKADFTEFDFEVLTESVVDLTEGPFHQGTGSVIRCVARKR